ncbi:efflux RND transporter periplasmic adaptor subunit [Rhodoferax sediminis]|uniref:Efflux RND transporter periplasmic adaptor subunit n=1 Tax=Rhodoferax sediminis TaxID=2509614 RepID=A0A515DCJ5_9BURK|nr:efflux RND transporter periplasmic adaptor subunit [Rhodoferax sediminis]QDL38138.1 efflux RND transporter periplasmic adaptor subunit [Rhodoferax sediminis]
MLKAGLATLVVASCVMTALPAGAADGGSLATVTVQAAGSTVSDGVSFDGVVEAVRQTNVSAQVSGAIVALNVSAGERVRAGQELLRIDARAAAELAAASAAQARAAQAALSVASADYERQKQLFQKQYISQSALDRAQGQFQAARAQVQALQAQASATHTQSGFFVVTAPYAGVVSAVPVALGDMATPGRPLVTLYDPSALRVTAAIPQSALQGVPDGKSLRLELPGAPVGQGLLEPGPVQILPAADAATHTLQVRLDVPAGVKGLVPGMFARVWLPVAAASSGGGRLYIPASAVVRRAEMTGLYVIGANGRPLLRQIRVGPLDGDRIEVLSGVQKGERIAADPQAAARVR